MIRTVKTLSRKQKKCVKELGFESMIHLQTDIIVSCLSHYVLEMYDPKTNMIKVGESAIQVTEEKIKNILGVSSEGTDLILEQECESDDEIYLQWKAKRISTLQDLEDNIEESEEADEIFELNFLILFVNTIIQKQQTGALDTTLVRKFVNVKNRKNINWCKYINDVLTKSKRKWKPTNKGAFYNGPIIFLMVSTNSNAFITI